jgi:hypothetical protein
MRVDRTVRLSLDKPLLVTERLERPGAILTLRSTPPGASFVVNGRTVGRGPTKVPVNGFTTVNIRASLDGYTTYRERHYVRGTSATIDADMVPSGRSASSKASSRRRAPIPEL